MVKHNNVIPNVHLRKHWQTNVRTWLNQAARKKRRLQARRAKAAANAPRPIDSLRPTVNCATIRYNHRLRFGRGISTITQDLPSMKLKLLALVSNSPDQLESLSITVARTDVKNLLTAIKTDLFNMLINSFSSPETRRILAPRQNPESLMILLR